MYKPLFLWSFIVGFHFSFLSFGTTFVPISIKKQIQESDAVIEGIISNTEVIEHEGQVVTNIEVNLDRWMGIDPEDNQVTIMFPGGTLGSREVLIHGAPEFNLGENVVLFLQKDSDGNLWLPNLGLSKFSVKRVGIRKVIVNQIFPGRPAVGEMDFDKFVDLSQWVKKKNFSLRFKDKYEVNHDKTVKQYMKYQGRSIASVNENSNENHEEGFPVYWLVFLLGCLGILFRLAKNKAS